MEEGGDLSTVGWSGKIKHGLWNLCWCSFPSTQELVFGREEGEGLGSDLGLSSEMTGQALEEVNSSSEKTSKLFFPLLSQPNTATT